MQNECSYVIEYFRSHGNADLTILSTAAFKRKQTPKPKQILCIHVSNGVPSIRVGWTRELEPFLLCSDQIILALFNYTSIVLTSSANGKDYAQLILIPLTSGEPAVHHFWQEITQYNSCVSDFIPSNLKKQFHRCPRITKWSHFCWFPSLLLQTISIYKNRKPNWFCTMFLLLWPHKRNLLNIAKWCY